MVVEKEFEPIRTDILPETKQVISLESDSAVQQTVEDASQFAGFFKKGEKVAEAHLGPDQRGNIKLINALRNRDGLDPDCVGVYGDTRNPELIRHLTDRYASEVSETNVAATPKNLSDHRESMIKLEKEVMKPGEHGRLGYLNQHSDKPWKRIMFRF